MSFTVEAIYEDGVLRLTQPLPLAQRERVQVTIEGQEDRVQRGQGLVAWKGDPKVLEHFAMDPIDEL